jgi:hypothetical protein
LGSNFFCKRDGRYISQILIFYLKEKAYEKDNNDFFMCITCNNLRGGAVAHDFDVKIKPKNIQLRKVKTMDNAYQRGFYNCIKKTEPPLRWRAYNERI